MSEEQYDIQQCHSDDGRIPIQDWLATLDVKTRSRIRIQIDKMEDGNFGDVLPVGSGVSETRMHFGPGYRVYFALKGSVVHLLFGGDKSTQSADITFAIKFWGSHEKD